VTTAARAARREELSAWFEESAPGFRAVETALLGHLGDALRDARLDAARLETRTKTLVSFLDKATASDGRGGFKYADPRTQLTDVVGARVLVPLSADVAPVARLVQRLYVVEEMSDSRVDQRADVPGYQSLHFLLRFRPEDREQWGLAGAPDVAMELQVRSILQHAWAALQHDVMYKAERVPSSNVRRRLIALAGLLELADQEFMAVRVAHGDPAGQIEDGDAGGFDTAAVGAWAVRLVGDEDAASDDTAWVVELRTILLELGATCVDDADDLVRDWGARGPAVARIVRAGRPWATSAFLADLVLRLALRTDYLLRRSVSSPDGVEALEAECSELAAAVEQLP
jgi:ppGpp synthetase/RelA/SpoT-type nucleotidyltranferase